MSRVEMCFFDRTETVDKKNRTTAIEIPYLVFDVQNENEALLAVKAEEIAGMLLDSKRVDERVAKDIWRVLVSYKTDPDAQDSSESQDDEEKTKYQLGFKIGTGGTRHISHAIKTVKKYPSDAPDFAGAINYDGQTVNGLDLQETTVSFTETIEMTVGDFSYEFIRRIAAKCNKVNEGSFKGFKPGEVLFLGATIDQNSKEKKSKMSVTYEFAFSENKTGIDVGGQTVDKKGWEYLWVKYKPEVSQDKKFLLQKPQGVYVEQVYETVSFVGLGGDE